MRARITVITAILVGLTTAAVPTEYKLGTLVVENPWTRATPKGATIAGGYLTIKNTGPGPDRLIGGTIEIASRFEIHETKMEGDVAKMREHKGIDIKLGETIEFKPGSSHIMFVNLKQQLQRGETVKGTLVFEHAGTIEIEYTVEAIGAQTGGHPGGHAH